MGTAHALMRAVHYDAYAYVLERVKVEMAAAWGRVEGLSSLKLLDAAQSYGGDHG